MYEIIYRGLRLASKSGCKYYNVKEGNTCSLVEDPVTSTLTLTYTPGSTSETLSDFLGIQRVGRSMEMQPTYQAKRFTDVYVTLNGSESRVSQTYEYTTIVISEEDYANQEFVNFLFYSGNLMYLKPVGPKPKCWEIRNFPKIIIKDKDLNLTSNSKEVFTLRRRYDDYVIRSIDYQDQFILELRRILDDYGIELVRLNKEETLRKTSYITYQFNQTPSKYHHPNYSDEDNTIMSHRVPVEFTLRTPDMVMFFDFKNKYNNVDLLTNFCEFKTADRYGDRWTAAVKWQQITEDFNHTYQSDDNSNFSYQCQFRCELYFYEMIDERYLMIKEIEWNLNNSDSNS